MLVFLKDAKATETLGRMIAHGLPERAGGLALMLEGELGCGKTTFTRGLVKALPGGDMAEVSSPSFNIVNLYPTVPQVAHFDLYRLDGAAPDEDLLESLSEGDHLVIVEWAGHLDPGFWPTDRLHLSWRIPDHGREVLIRAAGRRALDLLVKLQPGLAAEFAG
jgi:tRNA threonylcarbamoyladenosine biosynthesis protein TsaE